MGVVAAAMPLAFRFSSKLLKMGAAAAAALGAFAVGTPPLVASGARDQVRFVGGECDSLVLAGRRLTQGCKPQLVTMLYRSGNISFVFAPGDGRLVSFLGRVERHAANQTSLRVGQVTVITRGGASAFVSPAAGNCVMTAFAINRTRLDCAARAGRTAYSALFRTRDEEPVFVSL